MAEPLHSIYQSRRDAFQEEASRFKKKARLYSTLRLITAAFVLVAIWQALTQSEWALFLLALAGSVVFILIVRQHGLNRAKHDYSARLKTINAQEIAALNGHPGPGPAGDAYRDPAHPYSHDLDIFGPNSIFQLVNRTASQSGEALLAQTLTETPADADTIRARQRAIAELAPLIDFRQHFMAKGLEGVQETPAETRQLFDWLNAPPTAFNTPFIRVLIWLSPIIAIVLLGLAIANVVPHAAWILTVLFNLTFTGLFLKRINRIHAVLSRKYVLLEKFSLLLAHVGEQTLTDNFLRSLQENTREASSAILRLTKILSFFDQRLNFMVGAALNGFLLADLRCIVALDRWRMHYRSHMPGWLNSIFRFDELISFATFRFNHPAYCLPELNEEPVIAAEQLGHPLLSGSPCVLNDFLPDPEEKVVVLTGANMSGKSTFLRSLGVNLVLAYAGAPVYARTFRCSLTGVWSSMRVTDSLRDDTSYFYAEVKRLSLIMEQLRQGKKLIILLDEILKGTNSADKLYGSTGLVQEFLEHDCLCVIATHDLELGKLEEKHKGQVSNYCFESTINGNKLQFDYRLQKGIAQNKNATFLMRREGLIR